MGTHENTQKRRSTSPFTLKPKFEFNPRSDKETPSQRAERLKHYNEWREADSGASKTSISTEMLMSRPFSTFRALREAKGNSPLSTDFMVANENNHQWFSDEDDNEAIIQWDGIKSIFGALTSLLGNPINTNKELKGQNLLAQRRQRLTRSAISQKEEKVPTEAALPIFPLGFKVGLTIQPTLNQYQHLYQKRLPQNSSAGENSGSPDHSKNQQGQTA